MCSLVFRLHSLKNLVAYYIISHGHVDISQAQTRESNCEHTVQMLVLVCCRDNGLGVENSRKKTSSVSFVRLYKTKPTADGESQGSRERAIERPGKQVCLQ